MVPVHLGTFHLNVFRTFIFFSLEGLGYCYANYPRRSCCCYSLRPRLLALSPLTGGSRVSFIVLIHGCMCWNSLCLVCRRDGTDLTSCCPTPTPMQCPRNARALTWAQLCSAWVEAKTADSTGCRAHVLAAHVHSACYPVLPAINTIPSKQAVTTQSMVRS